MSSRRAALFSSASANFRRAASARAPHYDTALSFVMSSKQEPVLTGAKLSFTNS